MSSARQIQSVDAESMLESADVRSSPNPEGDDPRFDGPVSRAEWLEKVLCQTFDMDEDDAKMICGLVIEQFGQKDEVLDDEIDPTVRSVFYTLEAKRILTFRRIEYENEDGATFRGFFWRFHPNWQPPQAEEDETGDGSIYEKLPEDCWERSAAS